MRANARCKRSRMPATAVESFVLAVAAKRWATRWHIRLESSRCVDSRRNSPRRSCYWLKLAVLLAGSWSRHPERLFCACHTALPRRARAIRVHVHRQSGKGESRVASVTAISRRTRNQRNCAVNRLLGWRRLLIRSFMIYTRVDLGFDPKNLLYFELNLPPTYKHTKSSGSCKEKRTDS